MPFTNKIEADINAAEKVLATYSGEAVEVNGGFAPLARELQGQLFEISPDLVPERLQLTEGVGVHAFWHHKSDGGVRQTLVPQVRWL